MATERFIDITVRSSGAEKNVKSLDKRMKDLGKTTDGAAKTLRTLTKVASAVAVAVAAAGAATVAMVKSSADARRETEQLARLVKISANEFNALAFATKQYGVSAEQIADISKDIADRVGEFSAAGTGTFQDYADVLKLTKDQAAAAAKEFQFMAGPEVIQKMVSEMEAANVTGAQMTFVLESMGNDLSKLQPLFSKNGEELKKLTSEFSNLNSELDITTQQSEALNVVSKNFDLMESSATASSLAISATLAPVLNDLFKSVILQAPIATLAVIDFINAFKDPENINSITSIDRAIVDLQASILEMRNSSFLGFELDNTLGIEAAESRIAGLVAQRAALQNAPVVTGVTGGDVGDGAGTSIREDANQKKMDATFEFFNNERLATEKHLQDMFDIEIGFRTAAEIDEENRHLAKLDRLTARKEAAIELAGADEDLKADLRDEFNNTEIAAVADHEARITQIQADEAQVRKGITRDQFTNQLSITATALNAFATLSDKDNKKQKKFQKTAIVANTAVAVVKSFNNGGGYPWGIPPAIAMAAAGAAQLSKVGGGGGGGGVTQSGGAPTIPPSISSGPTSAAQNIPSQTRVVDVRIDDNALLTGAMFKEAFNSVLESDSDLAINITNAQSEAVRTGGI